MRFVPLKSIEQQDIQAVHRVRSEVIKQRTAKANQIRGLVAEYDVVAPTHLAQLGKTIPVWLEDSDNAQKNKNSRTLTFLNNLTPILLRIYPAIITDPYIVVSPQMGLWPSPAELGLHRAGGKSVPPFPGQQPHH